MKKLLAILIAGAFASSAFAADASAPMAKETTTPANTAMPMNMQKNEAKPGTTTASGAKHSKKKKSKHHKAKHKAASAA